MQKDNIALLLLAILGIALIGAAWTDSYPIFFHSTSDFLFNHIPLAYWIGLPIVLGSLYAFAHKSRNPKWKWIAIFGIFMAMYSLSYFYYMLPGPDSHYFRGLSEYFVSTDDLNPSKPYHEYYEWPLFFTLFHVANSLLGIQNALFEFMLYALIGLIFATCLYLYSSRLNLKTGYVAVPVFFILMHFFLNYQCVPFSLAFGLFLLLLVLDISPNLKRLNAKTILLRSVIFTGIVLMHPFTGAYYLLYLLLTWIITRENGYVKVFTLFATIYLVKLAVFSPIFTRDLIGTIEGLFSLEYSLLFKLTFVGPATPLDAVAQMFSRFVTITTGVIAGAGFLIAVKRRKFRTTDYSLFICGLAFAIIGILVPIVGTRAFSIVIIPISLGAIHVCETKRQRYFSSLFLVLTILFVFIPLHDTFFDSQVLFETNEEHMCSSFMVSNYNWNRYSVVLSHDRVEPYLQVKSSRSEVLFVSDFPVFSSAWAEVSDAIVYTVGLGKSFVRSGYSEERMISELCLNTIYNSGSCSIEIRSGSLTPS